jgi:hypothetical protein
MLNKTYIKYKIKKLNYPYTCVSSHNTNRKLENKAKVKKRHSYDTDEAF